MVSFGEMQIRLVSTHTVKQSIVLPLLYNPTSNETQLVPTNRPMGRTYEAAARLVTAFQERSRQQGIKLNFYFCF